MPEDTDLKFYRRKDQVVEAKQIDEKAEYKTQEYSSIGNKGDWMVVPPDGKVTFMDEKTFNENYEPNN